MPVMDNAYALVIGIAEYQHINTLPRVQDAQHIADLLIDPNYCGFPTDHVKLLLDGQASQTALRQGLGDLAERSHVDSTVLIFFSEPVKESQHGRRSEHLLGGLHGGVASDDGLVRIFDLFEYLQPRVTKAHPRQHPIFKAELEENFPVALYRGGARGTVPQAGEGFRYDAYISYVDREPDSTYVWDTLVPRLKQAGLKVAVSNDSQDPGVARVVGVERGIRESKRTVVVLSEVYLADHMADFENVLGQTMGVQEGTFRLLPVKIATVGEGRLPTRLGMLATLDLTHPRRSEREFERLVEALQGPLPTR
jgi:hypothetical protein